jgi:uncharacterized ion transporter superfamily protein YfcC
VVGVLGMFVSQSLANFIVPSGSGQAALTMPVMAPLAGMSWIKWAKWVLPLILIQTAIGAVAIMIAHAIGYQ